jgi:hypothetical protein
MASQVKKAPVPTTSVVIIIPILLPNNNPINGM